MSKFHPGTPCVVRFHMKCTKKMKKKKNTELSFVSRVFSHEATEFGGIFPNFSNGKKFPFFHSFIYGQQAN